MNKLKIWIDIKNSHEPLYFKSFINHFSEYDFFITAKDFADTVSLLDKYGYKYSIMGGRPEGHIIKRGFSFFLRFIRSFFKVYRFDFALNHMSMNSIYISKLRFKKNITLGDNDIDHFLNKKMFNFVDYFICPSCIPKTVLINDGLESSKIYQHEGFKEDIYIADFKPDYRFMENLPFKEYVAVRPESLQATYVPQNTKSIIPELIKELSTQGQNILFLPRYKSDINLAAAYKNVYIPENSLNGLDICYNSKAVLTGAGTFSREAACMGIPAVSFYPGEELLSVDRKMIDDGRVFHSRDPKDIVEYLSSVKKRHVDLYRSRKVQEEVFGILKRIFEE